MDVVYYMLAQNTLLIGPSLPRQDSSCLFKIEPASARLIMSPQNRSCFHQDRSGLNHRMQLVQAVVYKLVVKLCIESCE